MVQGTSAEVVRKVSSQITYLLQQSKLAGDQTAQDLTRTISDDTGKGKKHINLVAHSLPEQGGD